MERVLFITQMDQKLKLIRTEYDLTQEKMADMLGISKKTLVDIEKGRRSLGWTGSVALAALFSDSEILQNAYGGELSDLLTALAFQDVPMQYPPTMGGKIWWHQLETFGGYQIQQNMISQHYRILTPQGCRIASSFSREALEPYVAKIKNQLTEDNAMHHGTPSGQAASKTVHQ